MRETQEMLVRSLGWENPLEKGLATHSSILQWFNSYDSGMYEPQVPLLLENLLDLPRKNHTYN